MRYLQPLPTGLAQIGVDLEGIQPDRGLDEAAAVTVALEVQAARFQIVRLGLDHADLRLWSLLNQPHRVVRPEVGRRNLQAVEQQRKQTRYRSSCAIQIHRCHCAFVLKSSGYLIASARSQG